MLYVHLALPGTLSVHPSLSKFILVSVPRLIHPGPPAGVPPPGNPSAGTPQTACFFLPPPGSIPLFTLGAILCHRMVYFHLALLRTLGLYPSFSKFIPQEDSSLPAISPPALPGSCVSVSISPAALYRSHVSFFLPPTGPIIYFFLPPAASSASFNPQTAIPKVPRGPPTRKDFPRRVRSVYQSVGHHFLSLRV